MEQRINKEKLLELSDYYREALLPLGIIFVCILLVLFVVFPQLLASFNNRSQYNVEKDALNVLNDNLSYISVLDTSSLEDDLNKVSQAIPAQVNFDSIISGIYYAAASSGMSIGQFQFGIPQTTSGTEIAAVSLTIKVNSGPQETLAFIKELYKIYPLSKVESIRVEDKIRELSIAFYYKPLITGVENNSDPIPRIESEDEEILREISSWKNSESALAAPTISTSSGGLNSTYPF